MFALSIGTGDREDLWGTSQQEGRFFVFVDDSTPTSSAIEEADLVAVDPLAASTVTADYLLNRSAGQRGWFMPLEPDERVITKAFGLSGVSFFSSYQPETALTDANGNPISTSGGCSLSFKDTNNFCSRGGTSRIFVVNTTNADGFLFDSNSNPVRLREISNFVSNPYTEAGQTKNPVSGGGGTTGGGGLSADQEAVMNALKELFPDQCKFANYRIDVRTVAADTSVQHIAAVPICIVEKNFRDL